VAESIAFSGGRTGLVPQNGLRFTDFWGLTP
jgi:hypothetical protein